MNFQTLKNPLDFLCPEKIIFSRISKNNVFRKMKEETKEKINQLQNLEQNINSIIAQKQQFQAQNLEVDNALEQLKNTDKVFRIIGNIMVASSKDNAKKELTEKKEILDLRLKTFDKQEEKLRNQANELQQEVMKEMKKDGRGAS